MSLTRTAKSPFLFLLLLPLFLQAQEITLAQTGRGPCTIRLTATIRWQALTVRAHRADLKQCTVGQEVLLHLVKQAVTGKAAFFKSHDFKSIFIGRIVEYPGLMSYLLEQSKSDSLWLKTEGRPAKGDVNSYVARIMAGHPLTAQINRLLQKAGYRVSAVSVEKVLVGSYRRIPRYQGQKFSGALPFDAQMYFTLSPVKEAQNK